MTAEITALAVAAQSGEGGAFTALHRAATPKLRMAAFRVTGDEQAVDDLVAAAWERIWTRLSLFDPARGGFVAWASQIVARLSVDLYRCSTWRRVVLWPDGMLPEEFLPVVESAESAALRALTVGQVRAAIAGLAPSWARVVWLHVVAGLSFAESAAVLGSTVGTVRDQNKRARRVLRESLAGVL